MPAAMLNSADGATFRQAQAAYAGGDVVAARLSLERMSASARRHGPVLHLIALVMGRIGDHAGALATFESALVAAPNDAAIHADFAGALDKNGDSAAALQHYDEALRLSPTFANARFARALLLHRQGRTTEGLAELDRLLLSSPNEARLHSARGSMLRDAGRLVEAAAAYDLALKTEPSRAVALHGRARVAMELGEANSAGRFATALEKGANDAAVHLGYVEALEADGRGTEALEHLQALLAVQPAWSEGQTALARLRWEAGDRDGFVDELRKRVRSVPTDAKAWQALVAALAGADLFDDAADAARDARSATGERHGFGLLEATYASEAGEIERADDSFASLRHDLPGRALHEASHQLRRGDIDGAAGSLERARSEQPWSVAAWALTSVVWRLLKDGRAAWLNQQPGLIETFDLGLSDDALAGIADTLRSLHRSHAHPLGQSLRGGTQTRGRLFDRAEPTVVELRQAVERNVQAYWNALPPLDPTHPLLRHRGQQPALLGSWSVRLTDGGFHIAHFHTRGLVSSACYFVVPDTVPVGEGWLDVGGAPKNLGLSLEPLRAIAPVPGTMALFPSYLFHGTQPFAAGERITAAFDVIAR